MNEQDDEGNAKELNFGVEFSEDAQFLMIDEVACLMDICRKRTEGAGGQTTE
jgi:hypothetical protein